MISSFLFGLIVVFIFTRRAFFRVIIWLSGRSQRPVRSVVVARWGPFGRVSSRRGFVCRRSFCRMPFCRLWWSPTCYRIIQTRSLLTSLPSLLWFVRSLSGHTFRTQTLKYLQWSCNLILQPKEFSQDQSLVFYHLQMGSIKPVQPECGFSSVLSFTRWFWQFFRLLFIFFLIKWVQDWGFETFPSGQFSWSRLDREDGTWVWQGLWGIQFH